MSCVSEDVRSSGGADGGTSGSAGSGGSGAAIGGSAGTAGADGGAGGSSAGGGAGGSSTGGGAGGSSTGGGAATLGGAAGSPDSGAGGTDVNGAGGSGAHTTSTGGSSGTICVSPLILCGDVCVDPASNPEHCGASGDCLGDNAGARCEAAHACRDGACTSWETPVTLQADPAPVCRWLDLAMNDEGHAVLAWFDSGDGEGHIRTSVYAPDSGWSDAETLLTPAGAPAREAPSVAISPESTAMVVWDSVASDSMRILWSSGHDVESTWSAAQLVDPNQTIATLLARTCEVAMDAFGNAVIVCATTDTPGIWSNYLTEEAGWADTVIIDSGQHHAIVHLAMNPSGRAIAIWREGSSNSSTDYVRATWFDPDWTWVTTETIYSQYDAVYSDPDAAIDGSGRVVAIWRDDDRLRAQRFTADDGWGSIEIVPSTTPAYGPRVGMDGSGNSIIAWYGGDKVWANHHSVELGWSNAEALGTLVPGSWLSDATYPLHPKLAVGAAGDAVVVWPQVVAVDRNAGDKFDIQLWSNRYVPDRGWGQAELIHVAFAGDTLSFDVAIDAQGNAIVAWSPEEYPTYELYVSRSTRPE